MFESAIEIINGLYNRDPDSNLTPYYVAQLKSISSPEELKVFVRNWKGLWVLSKYKKREEKILATPNNINYFKLLQEIKLIYSGEEKKKDFQRFYFRMAINVCVPMTLFFVEQIAVNYNIPQEIALDQLVAKHNQINRAHSLMDKATDF